MNKLKNNAWFRKAGMALLDIVLIVLSVYLSMELRFEMYIPSRHMETMYAAMPMVVVVYMDAMCWAAFIRSCGAMRACAMWRGCAC